MEFIKDFAIAGFLFFLVKGLVWLVLLRLAYAGIIRNEKLVEIKERLQFWKRK